MKIALLLTSLLFTSVAFASGSTGKAAPAKADAAAYKVQTKNSKLEWVGKKVTGSHNGTVKIKSGSLKFMGPELVGGEFVVDMTTIKNIDVKDAEWRGKLEGHLKNPDFFDTTKHKTAKLNIKDVKLGKGGKYNVVADLTIKGITKPVMFDADIMNKGKEVTAKADIVFNRTHYGIKYKSGKFFENLGDKLIYDDVTLKVNLKAKN